MNILMWRLSCSRISSWFCITNPPSTNGQTFCVIKHLMSRESLIIMVIMIMRWRANHFASSEIQHWNVMSSKTRKHWRNKQRLRLNEKKFKRQSTIYLFFCFSFSPVSANFDTFDPVYFQTGRNHWEKTEMMINSIDKSIKQLWWWHFEKYSTNQFRFVIGIRIGQTINIESSSCQKLFGKEWNFGIHWCFWCFEKFGSFLTFWQQL